MLTVTKNGFVDQGYYVMPENNIIFPGFSSEKLTEFSNLVHQHFPSLEASPVHTTSPRGVLSEKDAIRMLQNFWRMSRIKSLFTQHTHQAYLSLYSDEARGSDDFNLSALTYGLTNSLDYNVSRSLFVEPNRNKMQYHRYQFPRDTIDEIKEKICIITEGLIQQLTVAQERQDYYIIPMLNLRTAPLCKVLSEYLKDDILSVLMYKTDPNHEIILCMIPKWLHEESVQLIRYALSTTGFSPMYRALALSTQTLLADYPSKMGGLKLSKYKYFPEMMHVIDVNKASVEVHRLRQAVNQLMINLPGSLGDSANHRIKLFRHQGEMFYTQNYYKYVLHVVYPVVHEISLHFIKLIKNKQDACLNNIFQDFSHATQTSLLSWLGLNQDTLNQTHIASAMTASGSAAYNTAFLLAKKMNLGLDTAASLKAHIIPPFYFELSDLNQYSPAFKDGGHRKEEANIYMSSIGPMMSVDRGRYFITPGNDINAIIKTYCSNKPCVLLLDISTAMYKNLTLDPAHQALVEQGKLSIILFESTVKFRLLHTDQFQAGRLFALCSKLYLHADDMQHFKEAAKHDFNTHADLLVSGYISTHCETVLERIKQRHFENGAILKAALEQSGMIHQKIVSNELSLTRPDEHYFITFDEAMARLSKQSSELFELRESFGHYRSSICGINRFSAGAADPMETLIEFAHLYWLSYIKQQPQAFYDNLLFWLHNYQQDIHQTLPLDNQVCLLVLLNALSRYIQGNHDIAKRHIWMTALPKILDYCIFFKPKEYYQVLRRQCVEVVHTSPVSQLRYDIIALLNTLESMKEHSNAIQTDTIDPLWHVFIKIYRTYLHNKKYATTAHKFYAQLLLDIWLVAMISDHRYEGAASEARSIIKQAMFKNLNERVWNFLDNTNKFNQKNGCFYFAMIRVLHSAGMLDKPQHAIQNICELFNLSEKTIVLYYEFFYRWYETQSNAPKSNLQTILKYILSHRGQSGLDSYFRKQHHHLYDTNINHYVEEKIFKSDINLFNGLDILTEASLITEENVKRIGLKAGEYAHLIAMALKQLDQHQSLCDEHVEFILNVSTDTRQTSPSAKSLAQSLDCAYAIIRLKKHGQLTTENLNFIQQWSNYSYCLTSIADAICNYAKYNKLDLLYQYDTLLRPFAYTKFVIDMEMDIYNILFKVGLLNEKNMLSANEDFLEHTSSERILFVSALKWFFQKGLLLGPKGQDNFNILSYLLMREFSREDSTYEALAHLYKSDQLTQPMFEEMCAHEEEDRLAFVKSCISSKERTKHSLFTQIEDKDDPDIDSSTPGMAVKF